MNQKPRVSVILPTYNRAQTLGAAIHSVLGQTYEDFELIVVDDGSTDDTHEVIGNIDDARLKPVHYSTNRGAAHARNEGLRQSRGDYIAFHDSDDEWLPRKLERQMEAFEGLPEEFGVVYCDMRRVPREGDPWYWASPEIVFGEIINRKTLDYQTMSLGIISLLVKRDCFKVVGSFDEEFTSFEDLDLHIRLALRYRFHHIREALVTYYENEGVSASILREYRSRQFLLEKYGDVIKQERPFLSRQQEMLGYLAYRAGRPADARPHFLRALRLSPLSLKYWGSALASLPGQRTFDALHSKHRSLNRRAHERHSISTPQ